MSEYKYPADDVFHQEEIKKSTFIVHIGHTPDLNSAKAFIKNIEEISQNILQVFRLNEYHNSLHLP